MADPLATAVIGHRPGAPRRNLELPTQNPMPSTDIKRLGPYEIVGTLGRGGMGTVYKAIHTETGEAAAVKLLSAELAQDEGFRSRFEAEIETLRKLNHPNIVRLFGFGEQDGQLFYAMELVDGNSLEEELRHGRHFDWREVTRIGVDICRALRHAHDRGVIHRDIKPGNLLMAGDSRVKLSDFGIARLFGYSRLTSAGNVLGTAEYMSPEQADGRPVDYRSDLYSLGALMYALLARRPVFRGKSLPEMLRKQRFEEPEPIGKHVRDLPEELGCILSQLLQKEPARRIPTADIVARRLEAMLQSLSVSPETLDADPDWFLSNEPAQPQPIASPSDVPATLDIGKPPQEPPQDATLFPKGEGPPEKNGPPEEEHKETASDAGATVSPSRFVAVSENELDPREDEKTRPAMISWQTWALAAALLSVGLSVWWFLQPPTADDLFDRITAMTTDGSIDSIGQAEPYIHDFVNRYSNDHGAAELRKYEQEIELDRLQRQFDSPIKRLTNTADLGPIERAYDEAMNYVRLAPEIGVARLQAIVDLYDRPGHRGGASEQCLILAKRRLATLREEIKKRSDKQLHLLESRLADADALRQDDPKRAEAMYRAAIELYADKPWAAEAVARARDALKKPRPK